MVGVVAAGWTGKRLVYRTAKLRASVWVRAHRQIGLLHIHGRRYLGGCKIIERGSMARFGVIEDLKSGHVPELKALLQLFNGGP